MSSKLTLVQIQELAHREGVRTMAVVNFLSTLFDVTQGEALANLEMDARSYQWNTQTNRAIQEGIMRAGLPVD